MPRRYRPPTRRRKSKKERFQREAAAPRHEGAAAPASSPLPPSAPVPVAVREERSAEGRHIARDHSYVLADLWRIAFIVAVIVVGLVITAILR